MWSVQRSLGRQVVDRRLRWLSTRADVVRMLIDTHETPQLQPAQEEAINAAVDGYSIFLHQRTGAGKSLAFQAPALLDSTDRPTIVISPLVALIHDQVDALRRKGVEAEKLMGDRVKSITHLRRRLEGTRLIYTTPEFLLLNTAMQTWIQEASRANHVARIVLDEAHCVLEWGTSFRPSYLELCRWRDRYFSNVPVTLTTATITDDDIHTLASRFHLQILWNERTMRSERYGYMKLIQHFSDRPNLRLEVVKKTSTVAAKYIASRIQSKPTIVYCLTKNEAEKVSAELQANGCSAGVYHSGMPRSKREFVRKRWMGGQLSVICATSAFGMGIDRPDVRFIVHYSLPLSLSLYHQQSGRAGRDGQSAVCLLLYNDQDRQRAGYVARDVSLSDASTPSSGGGSRADIEDVAALCETTGCRKEILYQHFGFRFQSRECNRNCNCGSMPLLDAEESALIEKESDSSVGGRQKGLKTRVPDAQIEILYHRLKIKGDKHGLARRERLSRKTIATILEHQPQTREEMGAIRGVDRKAVDVFFDEFYFTRK